MENIHGRFKDAPWYPKIGAVSILVGGAGGIGSWVAFFLARAGFKPFVCDFDSIEEHNLSGQLYSKSQIGMLKVMALKDLIVSHCDVTIPIVMDRIQDFALANIFTISCFDNMEARRSIYNNWKAVYGTTRDAIFIDASLAAEQFGIYCIKDRIAQAKYEAEYLSIQDSEIEEIPCSMRQTSHFAALVGAQIVTYFTNHYTNVVEGAEIRAVPFKTEYFGPLDLKETFSASS